MHDRAVAAGGGDQVALEGFARAGDLVCLHIDGGHAGAGDVLAALGLDHGAGGEDANAFGTCFFNQRATRVVAGVGNGDHLQAGVVPVQRGAVGVVVVGRQHQLAARGHAVAAYVGGHGTGQHVARQVVVAVHQRALVGAGSQHHALGADAVYAVAYLADRGAVAEVVGEALVDGKEVMVVVAVDRGTWQQGHFRQAFQLFHHGADPIGSRLAVEGFAGVEQAAAELFLLVSQDHAGTAAGCGQCSGQAGRASADDQHVAVLVHVVVAVRVVLQRRAAKARGFADVLLVSHPERFRVHEGFVVEARRHHAAAHLAQDAHDVVVDVRPAVGAGSYKTCVQRLLGGTHVGDLGGFAGADLQDGVRLFGTGGDDAAWARILEAAADDVDAVGQQCGGQAVTGITLVGLAVESEVQDLAAVDTAAAGEAIGLAHTFSPWPLTVDAALFCLPLAVTCGFSPIL